MKYTGQFKNIENHTYYVNITTNGDSSISKEIKLGVSPLITSIEGGDDYIYKPVKYSSSTIKILTEDYLYDLYSAKAQQNKVEVINYMGNTVWLGYTTPNLYSQGYENPIEEIEVECIDGLSTLQYINYTPIHTNKSIVTFKELINHLLSKCNCYSRFFISNVTYNPNYPNYYYWEKLKVSEMNFFDEDDEPMKCDEVLEELCQFMGVTCYADGTDIYFIDYDAIKNGVTTYWQYSIGSTSNPTIITKEQTHSITSDDYVENGGKLSLDNVFNKAIVKSSLYSFDDAIPDIFNEDDLLNYGTNQSYTENLQIEDTDGKGGKHKCFFRFYKNPNYKSTYYEYSYYTYTPIVTPSTINYSFIQNYVGATIIRGYFKKVDDYSENIGNLNFTDYLLIHTHDSNQTIGDAHYLPNMTVDNELGLPVFESVVDFEPAFIGGKDAYFVIKGSYLQMDREKLMYIPEDYSNDYDDFDEKYLWLKAKLEFNGQFWDGTQWTNTDTCFKLEFDADSTKHHINKDFKIKNTVNWNMGLDVEGYAIKLPSFSISTTKPKLTLYTPHRMDMSYRCDAVWLKNFGIELHIANRDLDADADTDTEYSNIIDEDYVNEMDDVEFKVCSWDNKKANYSAVGEEAGTNLIYLDKTQHKGTNQYLRQEEHFIYKLVNQYSTPSTVLEINLHNDYKMYATLYDSLLNKTFIIDAVTIDWFWEKAELKLIEKK